MARRNIRLVAVALIVALTLGALLGCAQQAAPTPTPEKPAVAATKPAAEATKPAAEATKPAAEPTKPAAEAKPAAKKVDFPTKEITYIVPVTPGGGFDTMSRIVAPFLQKYLPNNPNVIVKNVSGGEWMIGINEIYNAKPDGYTIGIFNLPGNVVNQLLGVAKYDLTKVTWIGSITEVPYVAAASKKSGFKTLDDLKKAPEVKVASVSLSSSAGLGSLIAAQTMGFKPKFISHPGSSEAILSTLRGDADYAQYPYGSMKKYVVDSKELTPLWIYDKKRASTLPDVPTVVDLGYPGLLDTVAIYYLVGTTPGVPPEIAQILRDAFDKAMADPECVKKLEAAGEEVRPAKAADVEKIVKNSLEQYVKYKDEIAKHIK